jgi:hypothetical protein
MTLLNIWNTLCHVMSDISMVHPPPLNLVVWYGCKPILVNQLNLAINMLKSI